jgi:transposase
MGEKRKQYTQEYKNTIIELYNSGKSITELCNEYGLAKSTIGTWLKKLKPITVDEDTTINPTDYKAMLKKIARLEEENEILKKAMAIFAKK